MKQMTNLMNHVRSDDVKMMHPINSFFYVLRPVMPALRDMLYGLSMEQH